MLVDVVMDVVGESARRSTSGGKRISRHVGDLPGRSCHSGSFPGLHVTPVKRVTLALVAAMTCTCSPVSGTATSVKVGLLVTSQEEPETSRHEKFCAAVCAALALTFASASAGLAYGSDNGKPTWQTQDPCAAGPGVPVLRGANGDDTLDARPLTGRYTICGFGGNRWVCAPAEPAP